MRHADPNAEFVLPALPDLRIVAKVRRELHARRCSFVPPIVAPKLVAAAVVPAFRTRGMREGRGSHEPLFVPVNGTTRGRGRRVGRIASIGGRSAGEHHRVTGAGRRRRTDRRWCLMRPEDRIVVWSGHDGRMYHWNWLDNTAHAILIEMGALVARVEVRGEVALRGGIGLEHNVVDDVGGRIRV